VADEQMFQQRINFLVLIAAQFRILVERKIVVPSNSPGLEHCRHSLSTQPFVLFAHHFRPHGATFYNCAVARQRYFRTTARSRRKRSPVSIFICSPAASRRRALMLHECLWQRFERLPDAIAESSSEGCLLLRVPEIGIYEGSSLV
jgi:hypothetical protein